LRDLTDISVLLDRSGSMDSIKSDTIGGFNTFVKSQQKEPGEATLTLVQFDSQGYDTVFTPQPVAKVPALTGTTFQPRGMTPLLDSMRRLIDETGARLAALPEEQRPDKVVVVIITDGLENASTRTTKAQIRDMVARQQEQFQWLFIYLGANQDAILEAGALGIQAQFAGTYNISSDGVAAAYAAVGQNVNSYRGGGGLRSAAFKSGQRAAMKPDDPDELKKKRQPTAK
jgi:hypothetical protein